MILYLSEWLSSERQERQIVGKDEETREAWYTVSGNITWCSHYGKQYESSSKNYK